jgi:hypothetical protein
MVKICPKKRAGWVWVDGWMDGWGQRREKRLVVPGLGFRPGESGFLNTSFFHM